MTTEKGTLRIRRMSHGDIDNVLILSKKVGGPHSHISYQDLVASDPGGALDMSFLAEDGNNLVGFVQARLEYVYVPVVEICLIHTMVVDPAYQRKGIGSMLVSELVSRCQLEGIGTIRALVNETDTELRTFITNLGFHRSKIINFDKVIET